MIWKPPFEEFEVVKSDDYYRVVEVILRRQSQDVDVEFIREAIQEKLEREGQ
jgi:hypothetical protein